MDQKNQLLRWLLAIIIHLPLLVRMEAALTPDGLALLEFKYSLSKISPLLENWKASDMSPCSWGGIKCTTSGNVQNITLSKQVPMLEGNISSSLGKLKSLERLMLDHNLLSGSIPHELGNLSSLLTLSLSNNSLLGEIPPQLGNCSSLIELWLDGNMLSGTIPKSLGNLKNLSSIFLGVNLPLDYVLNSGSFKSGDNLITGSIPLAICKNLNLKSFDVSHNNLIGDITTALEELSKHPNIEWISMEENSFTGTLPPSIGNATTLRWLYLWGQKRGGFRGQIPKEIGKLVNLVALTLSVNNFSGEIPSELGNIASLRMLDLGINNLSGSIPSSFGNLINLVSLELDRNNLTGMIPKELGKLVNVTHLFLTFNNIIGEIPMELGNMASLIYLALSNNNLNGTIPSSLGNLVNLEILALGNNSLIGPIPASFTSLMNLQKFHLTNNLLTGPFPTNISKMTALQEIDFWNNNMWGPIPEDFGRFMPNLTIFAMNNNFFNGTLPIGLCKGGNLQRLGVGGNQLEGAIPSSLARCTSLVDVDFNNNRFTSIPDDFGRNSSLELLGVARNQLTGQLPKGLGANSKLAELDLSENRFTGDISVLEFSQLAHNLSILNLAKNNFTGEIPTTMAMCKLLFQVDLSHNSLTGIVPPSLANLSRLETLQLQGNNLTRLDPSMYLSWATTLRILNLAENPWNGTIATEIGSLKLLQNLNLSYGGHIGLIPSELGKLTQLEVLDLSYNNLIGEVPSELGELMTSLVSINVSFNHLTGSLPPAWVRFLHANPDSFRGNPGLCLEYNSTTNLCVSKTLAGKAKLSFGVVVAIGMGGALALIITVAMLVWWLQGPSTSSRKPTPRLDDIIVKNLTNAPLPFTFDEIMAATENLSDAYIIGQGGHGVVYKVVSTSTCTSIAVKKIESLDTNIALVHKSFWREVETVGNAKHRNLVRLLGFMKCGEVGLLLYDYVSNGNLHSMLHNRETRGSNAIDLTWKVRLHIAEGVAEGLAYLHHDYNPPIVHRDIKSSNVLLDDDLCARISDFGLAKVLLASSMQPGSKQQWLSTPNVSGTYGYIAPEVGHGTPVTPKLDVYSFGVLLLELLTGRQPVDASYGETWHVVAWVKASVLQNEGIMSDSVLDPSLLHPTNLVAKDEMLSVQRIALLCTRENPIDRPHMRDVANLLKSLSQRMEMKNHNEDNEVEESQRNEIGILQIHG